MMGMRAKKICMAMLLIVGGIVAVFLAHRKVAEKITEEEYQRFLDGEVPAMKENGKTYFLEDLFGEDVSDVETFLSDIDGDGVKELHIRNGIYYILKEKEINIMAKYVCKVCGYVHEGDAAPAECPVCHAPASKFKEQEGDKVWAAEHVVGVAQGVSEDILADLRANFAGECSEVGMYLAMARVAHREGYPEIGLYWEKAAHEEAEHAAKFAELLGEVVTDSTKKNLEMRVEAEHGATAGKFDLAKRAKAANLDAIHDTVHEMARDEARHGKAFEGLLKRYFG